MKKGICLMLALTFCFSMSYAVEIVHTVLNKYKSFLEEGTFSGADWPIEMAKVKSRYDTFLYVFDHFVTHTGKVIVELGTSRSFTHGGLPGCNRDEIHFWTPHCPENWDWGAGFFTRMAAECLQHVCPNLHTIDISSAHIARCKYMTRDFSHIITYHICSSVDFLKNCKAKSIDLLYLDTGDMTPIEPTALLQLAEACIIVERNLLTDTGLLLIDDVRNQTPAKFGDSSGLGKSKYAIPYLLAHGFEIVMDEYQVIMRKK